MSDVFGQATPERTPRWLDALLWAAQHAAFIYGCVILWGDPQHAACFLLIAIYVQLQRRSS